MLADGREVVKLMQQIAVNAVNASKPCCFVYGTVTDIIEDSEKKIINVKVRLDAKLEIDIDFLVFGKSLTRYDIKTGDKLILLRQAGGQLFYVADICEGGDDNATE